MVAKPFAEFHARVPLVALKMKMQTSQPLATSSTYHTLSPVLGSVPSLQAMCAWFSQEEFLNLVANPRTKILKNE
jgi:hypothetical protein